MSVAWDLPHMLGAEGDTYKPPSDVYLVGKLLSDRGLRQGLVTGSLARLQRDLLAAPGSGLDARGALSLLSGLHGS